MKMFYIFRCCVLFFVIIVCYKGGLADPICPSLCSCKNSRSTDLYKTNVDDIEWIKLKCGGPENPITELKEINISKITNLVVNLNLSGNGISTLSRDLNLPQLQKLDISNNQISLIESDAFYNLTGLQRLDLSGNIIKTISKEIFKGLTNLEKLILSQNKITTLANDTFDYLLGLKQIDISGNPLKCECDLLWIAEWARSANIKLMGNPKCAQPPELSGENIKKLKTRLDLIKCGLVSVTLQNKLVLRPNNPQLVFEGDSLILSCKAPFSTIRTLYNLTWSLPNNTVELESFRISNVDILEEGLAETILKILRISSNHTGTYQCLYNNSNATYLTEDITVTVISNLTTYCPITVTSNNKGVYTWPGSVTGHTVSQPCHDRDGAQALYYCDYNGSWDNLDTSACPYVSETSKMLEQFALVNLSVYKGSTLAACKRLHSLLLQHTPPSPALSDPDDINFISKAVLNYMSYISAEPDVGSVLLDIVNAMMFLPSVVLKAAENLYSSCSSIVTAVENISHYTANVQGQKNKLVVEHFSIKRESFTGMTCLWYSVPTYTADSLVATSPNTNNNMGRMLHCSTTNRTITPLLNVRDKIIEASVQIPDTLLYRMDHQSLLSGGPGNLHRSYSLVVSMYDNAALFPLMPTIRTKERDLDDSTMSNRVEQRAITTPVVGVKLMNVTLTGPLASPMYIIVRDSDISAGVSGRAVLWDEETRTWSDSPDGCSVLRIVSNMVVIQCYKLGYVGLMQNVDIGIYGGRSGGARFRFSHTATYVGSIILLSCLVISILTYSICYPSIHMPPRAKHSLVNTWLSLGLLCFMYTLGIYQTEDIQLCQAIGIVLHYLTLSTLLWMTVAVSQLYKFLTKNQNPSLQSPDDELPSDVPIQKPILGIYLVGWGIALIVCGISAAVNMREYASYYHCFLSSAPALSAVFVPASIVIIFLSILFLLIRCTIRNVNGQLSEGTQATENVDLETWEPSLLVNNTADRQSEESSPETEVEDTEHTPVVQLRAHVIILVAYLFVWSFGTIAVYRPFSMPYEEDIFSILYAVFASAMGIFILFFYGIARSDVRSQWLLMHCYFKTRKQCCRARTVFDTNAQNVPSNAPHNSLNLTPISNIAAAAQARSRSNSQNSSRTNTKSNNSNILKAAAELNGQTLNDNMPRGNKKISNMSLVVLHRQQYRSNNSVTTFPESNTGAEMFYNPNQSNVARKFFKRQRKNIKKNYLDIPKRRNYDSDSQVSSHRPCELRDGMSSMLTSGSKVNNVNIHVEKGQLSDNGIKEASRNQVNPNILEDDEGGGGAKPQLKRFTLEKESHNHARLKSGEAKQSSQNIVMNIYTNVPETTVPQHQVVAPGDIKGTGEGHSSSMSAECLNIMPTMRTVSQQCSLEYSSTSEVATPHQLGSDKTLNTHSELNSLQEPHTSHDITSDTEEAHSFEKYTDFTKSKRGVENSKQHVSCSKLQNELKKQAGQTATPGDLSRSLQDIQQNTEEDSFDDTLPTPCSDHYSVNDNIEASERDKLMLGASAQYYQSNGELNDRQRYDNESDIYFPNYQMSEVSITSHGLYAPPPASIICGNDDDLHFSNSELSRVQNEDECYENQYVNYNPAWRKTKDAGHRNNCRYYSPTVSCPDVNRLDNDSPVSFVSEIDELYKQITSRDRLAARRIHPSARGHPDNLRHCESDSCISESHSDILDTEQQRGETRV